MTEQQQAHLAEAVRITLKVMDSLSVALTELDRARSKLGEAFPCLDPTNEDDRNIERFVLCLQRGKAEANHTLDTLYNPAVLASAIAAAHDSQAPDAGEVWGTAHEPLATATA